MMELSRRFGVFSWATMASFMVSCATLPPPEPEPEIVEIPIVVTYPGERVVPKGPGIVIEQISGDCSEEVEDALMSRLVDNAGYNVLTRRNLDQIIGESNINWEGRFNTETVNKIGELLGASMFVVGRVGYCGIELSDSHDADYGLQYTIIAVLQIIDMETGEVILASADQGVYMPRPAPSLPLGTQVGEQKMASGDQNAASAGNRNMAVAANRDTPPPVKAGFWKRIRKWLKSGGGDATGSKSSKKSRSLDSEPLNYLKIKAAEDLAGSFADKFFSRPTWERVQMWESDMWNLGNVVGLVRLGHCAEAVSRLESGASQEVERMDDQEVARYLHNYGVALLCANKPEPAMRKLRSSYRVGNNLATLRMLDLAERVVEWSLHVEVDEEPEIGVLLRREMYSLLRRSSSDDL